jgi:hypothetical protein
LFLVVVAEAKSQETNNINRRTLNNPTKNIIHLFQENNTLPTTIEFPIGFVRQRIVEGVLDGLVTEE